MKKIILLRIKTCGREDLGIRALLTRLLVLFNVAARTLGLTERAFGGETGDIVAFGVSDVQLEGLRAARGTGPSDFGNRS